MASLRDKEIRLTQALNDSQYVEARLLLKGRVKEAEDQQAQTTELIQKRERLQVEILELENAV